MFKVIFFSLTVYIGYEHILKDLYFNPPLMFGTGDSLMMFGDYPYTPMPAMLKPYYLLSLSYYVEDLASHLVLPPSSDYWEMALHHVITLILVSTSYMNSLWNIGIFVLVQMDVADFFIGLIRIFMEYSSFVPTLFVYIFIIASWVWLRFVCYFKISMNIVTFSGKVSIDNDVVFHQTMSAIMLILVALNIYWFILLINMGLRLALKGKHTDLQCVIKLSNQKKID